MGAHAVTVAVELHQGSESVRQAAAADAATIPSRPRRARHRIEEARAYQLDGQPDVALATLEKAHEAAPETIKYNGFAKRIVLEEAESKIPNRRRRASRTRRQDRPAGRLTRRAQSVPLPAESIHRIRLKAEARRAGRRGSRVERSYGVFYADSARSSRRPHPRSGLASQRR